MNLRRISAASGFVLVFVMFSTAQEEKPPVVPYLHPVARQVPQQLEASGRIDAPQVDLRARVSGYLEKVHFVEGAEVQEGDLLFEIDARPYRLELDRAEAQLRVSEARLRKVDAELARVKALLVKAAISQEELARSVAERGEAEAELAVTKASLQLVKLKLDYTQVRAPIAGRVGRRLVDVGNLVKADETLLAVLVGKPNRVTFSVMDRTATLLRRAAEKRGQSLEKVGLPVQFALSDEADFQHRAQLDFVDTTTTGEQGRLLLGATLKNPNPLLAPGMTVRLRLLNDEKTTVWEIPRTALEQRSDFRQQESTVLVLDADNRVQRKRVLLGNRNQETIEVTSGLTEKDRVVPTDRGLKVGTVVTPMNTTESNPK
jgi:RND family efflux transporter MFP subunit